MNPCIFLVDDEESILEVCKRIFDLNEIDLMGTAENGDEAIRKFKAMSNRPDLVIMDQIMPLKDGVTTMKEMHEIDPSVRVLFLSADTRARTKELALQNGAFGFIDKPFGMAELITAVRTAIHASAATVVKEKNRPDDDVAMLKKSYNEFDGAF